MAPTHGDRHGQRPAPSTIPQLRQRVGRGMARRDEKCSRIDLIGRSAPPGLGSPGFPHQFAHQFGHQADGTGVWLTPPLGVTTVRGHAGPVSNPIPSFCAAARRDRLTAEERSPLGAVAQVQGTPIGSRWVPPEAPLPVSGSGGLPSTEACRTWAGAMAAPCLRAARRGEKGGRIASKPRDP